MKKLTLALLVMFVLFSFVNPVRADDSLRVYYAGQEGGVKTALELAKFTLVTDPTQADVFVLNGVIPDAQAIQARLADGAGLVLILGADLTEKDVSSLLGMPLTMQSREDAVSTTSLDVNDSLVKEIVWNSAPQVRERFNVQTLESSAKPLVTAYEDDGWLLWQAGENTFVVNVFLDGVNPQIQEWAYYNYLIYHLVERAAMRAPQSFADYPASPVPHTAERNIMWAILALMVVSTFVAFYFVRRYSLTHPEALDKIVSDRTRFEVREEATNWKQAGFHRPLSGFLVALLVGLIFFVPLIIYQNLILPTYILPSAQALGIWGRMTQFFGLAWWFFDMGTSTAFIKYMSEYRVNDPKRGIQFGQVFVWWQLLSGAVQVAMVVALAANVAPRSAYALYAWSIIMHAIIQLPGFYRVFQHALTGFQRNDYARYLEVAGATLFPMIMQPLFVGLAFAWGKAHPAFGGAMGGLFGMAIAAYAAELLIFVIGWWLYRRIGLNVRVLFLAHFDWSVVKQSFGFGVLLMLGNAAWQVGQALEIWITQSRLINYTEIYGNWSLAMNLNLAFGVITTLTGGTMAAISEAISTGRKILSQYYTVMMYKWGGTIAAFLGAVLLAVGPRFLLGSAGPEFQRAATYVVPVLVWSMFGFPIITNDAVAQGSDKAQIFTATTVLEQTVRIVGVLVLLATFQVYALAIAYSIAAAAKGVAGYYLNHKYCYPQKIYFWQSFGATLLAGGVHYLLVSGISTLIWKGDQITSILILFVGLLPSLPVYMFLYGLFGGWDTDTLNEFREATAMAGMVRGIVNRMMVKPTALGARLSPLNNRFPIKIREAAMVEARELTEEMVKL